MSYYYLLSYHNEGNHPAEYQLANHDCAWLDFLLRLTYPIINLLLDRRKDTIVERLRSESGLGQQLKTSAYLILGLILVIWAVELVNLLLGHQLNVLGILPRTVAGLPGIILSPFLHNGIDHVLLNTIPLIILGGLVILHGPRAFVEVSLVIILVTGVGVWIFGRSNYHVGASGLIFGYFGFLVGRSWYERSISSILIALVTIVLYGGILLGVLPIRAGMSWEAHLFGLLGGILAARLVSVDDD